MHQTPGVARWLIYLADRSNFVTQGSLQVRLIQAALCMQAPAGAVRYHAVDSV